MSCYAIDFQKQTVAVACDSLAFTADRSGTIQPLGRISKVIPLPHLGAVMFGRGMQQVLWWAYQGLSGRPDLTAIEDVTEALGGILAEASNRWSDQVELQIDWRSAGLLEVVLVGWSQRDRRFKMWALNSYEGYDPQEDGGAYYGTLAFPNLGAKMPNLSGLLGNERYIEVMKAHRRALEGGEAQSAVGGDVMLWTLDPDGMSVKKIWAYPDTVRLETTGAEFSRSIMSGDSVVDPRDSVRASEDLRPIGDTDASTMSRQQRRRLEREQRKQGVR